MCSYTFFATCPRGVEDLLVEELQSFGAVAVAQTRAGVAFGGALEVAYRACLWSRIASRILLPVASFPAHTPDDLYEAASSIPWQEHLAENGTLAVHCAVSHAQIEHSHFAALTVKDAIVDQFRRVTARRPAISVNRPDVHINLYLDHDKATLSIDLSGESLHRRGYRTAGGSAPLKENLAAALLYRARWPETARAGGELCDPLCGSGTLLIEGALMAGDGAPALSKKYFGFLHWNGHDAQLWHQLQKEARERWASGIKKIPPIAGYDSDRQAVQHALVNVAQAGLGGVVHIEKRDITRASPRRTQYHVAGLVVTNPPYGMRQGNRDTLFPLYERLGETLLEKFFGWRAAVLTADDELAWAIGLRAFKVHTLYNGAIKCKLLHFIAEPGRKLKKAGS